MTNTTLRRKKSKCLRMILPRHQKRQIDSLPPGRAPKLVICHTCKTSKRDGDCSPALHIQALGSRISCNEHVNDPSVKVTKLVHEFVKLLGAHKFAKSVQVYYCPNTCVTEEMRKPCRLCSWEQI